ncbi:MAG: transketolase, partial [Burkholderiales bacterium]|nr:transketolase [Opitutaceae bacterium]
AERDLRADELGPVPAPAALLRLYAWVHLARRTDNRILELFRQGLMKGTVTGGQGNELLIVPLALLADKATDVVSFTHRDLGGHLIWGGHLCEHLNQYFANAASPTFAREGNIHHGDPANRSLPMISHLGSMLSHVAGRTDAQRRSGHAAVGYAIFGDGGSSTGDIHETLNLAALLSLPVVFIIENNHYAYSTPVAEQFRADTELWKRAAGYGIEGIRLDVTTDPLGSIRSLAAAIARARDEKRPILVEAHIARLRGHAAYDTCDYLSADENAAIQASDPLPGFRASLLAEGHAAAIEKIEADIDAWIETCIQISIQVNRPSAASLPADAYAPEAPALPWLPTVTAESASAENITFAQALTLAHGKILRERPESLVLGQDIGTYGGAFKITEGLLVAHGRARVFNTPLAESACTGWAIGMALGGHRPIEEFQFADFATEAMTQLTLNAATYHFRSGAKIPLVMRLPCGGGLTFGSFHSQELESVFLAMPGLKALYPSTAQDAFDCLLAAYEDDNPVFLFEHKALYRRGKHAVKWNPAYREVWQPRLVRPGAHATLVTYGEMVHLATEAAAYLETEYEKSVEVWDLRALAPLRLDAIRESLSRTHRLVVLHEGRRTHGFGAELISQLLETQFFDLEAPPLRIASLDLPVPFAPELEQAYRPTRDSIIEKLVTWLG